MIGIRKKAPHGSFSWTSGLRLVLVHAALVLVHEGVGLGEDGGEALDEAVACRVPFRVILLLEAVDVAEDEGERGAVRDRADVGEQGAAVADACELVTVTVAPSPVAHLPGSVRTL